MKGLVGVTAGGNPSGEPIYYPLLPGTVSVGAGTTAVLSTIAAIEGTTITNATDEIGNLLSINATSGSLDLGAVQSVPTTPPSPPVLKVPPLLGFLDALLGGVETVNANGTETIADSFFGIPLLVSTFDASGNLVSVDLFGFNITFLFR